MSRLNFSPQKLSLVLMTLVGVQATAVNADDWPTFRGADRTAVSSESGLLQTWGENGPKLLWTAKGAGRGYASPAISEGRMYTLGDGISLKDDADEYLTCFNSETGAPVWQTKTGEPWNRGKTSWQGSRATPTVDGDRVYVVTPHGKLVCAKTSNGSIVWTKDFKEDFSGKKKDSWGYSESPLVDGNKIIVTPGGEVSTVVALDKHSGEVIWTCARPEDVGAGHSSVVISQVGGRKVYVQNTGCGPLGVDAETGEMLWDYDIDAPTAFIPSPIIKGDLVYTVAGYGTGGALLRQVAGRGGSVSVKEIYGVRTHLANKHGGVVLVGDNLYFGNEDKNVIKCADLMTGELKWEKRGKGSGSTSVAYADGQLYLRYQNGTVSLADASTSGFKELSSFKAPESGNGDKPSWAHPVISGGRLFLREDDAILCYSIK